MGLATRNAILMMEFARALINRGENIIEATLNACRLRFRTILMTSLAFTLGVLFGMITATVLGLVYTPLFFAAISRIFRPEKNHQADAHTT